ncbi:exo-alpha-sialidase, partial [Clostridium tarantellae]
MQIRKDRFNSEQSKIVHVSGKGSEAWLDMQVNFNNKDINIGSSISGKVIDSNNNGVEGAIVKLMNENLQPLSNTMTDENGNYTITSIPYSNAYTMMVISEGKELKQIPVFTISLGENKIINFTLQSDTNVNLGIISGTLLDINSKGISGAIILLYGVENGIENLIAITYTDTAGIFVFNELMTGNYKVKITALGYKYEELSVMVNVGEITTTLKVLYENPEAPDGIISGAITDSMNNTVENADVMLYRINENNDLNPMAFTTANSKGLYTFINVPPGDYLIKSNQSELITIESLKQPLQLEDGSLLSVKDINTFEFSKGFSKIQGSNGWYYKEFVNGEYKDLNYNISIGNGVWQGTHEWCRIYEPSMLHPGPTQDIVLAFKCPSSGKIKISGNVKKANLGGGDGVKVNIKHNSIKLWPLDKEWQVIQYNDSVGYNQNITVIVQENDYIYFTINNNGSGNISQDNTFWNPVINYVVEDQLFKEFNVFSTEQDGYATTRIPGIVATSNGTLIAYCEGRSSGSDWATMDLVIKRSTDGGETWSEPIVLFDGINTGKTYNNPVMIADKNSGLVHLVYCIGYATAYYVKSLDHGVNWSTPVDITATFNEFKTEYNWVVIAAGPGHGIQLKNGRLIIPVWLALNKSHAPSVTSVIYSDDKGVTWKRGEIIKGEDYMPDPNETTAVELMDGSVLLNMRNKSSEKKRAVTISKDGVNNWSTPKLHEDLDDAVCFASMIRLTGNDEYYNNRILFSNINNTAGRSNLTIKVSMDEGNTWEITRTIYAGGAAYSDLAVSGDKKEIYCLYEKDGYNKLVLAKFNLEWITMDKQKLNPINDISKIVYPTSSNIVLTEEWNSLDKWNIAGQGQVNLTDMNTLSMYSNNGNNTSITNRHLNIRSKYSIEFKARFKDFVAGTLGANVTLGTKVCDGKYRLMLDFKPNGVYAITGLGTWESIKNVTINNDWNIWRVEVDNGNATLYVNNELMTTFTLALRASNDLVEHWINGLSNDVSEIEEEYFKLYYESEETFKEFNVFSTEQDGYATTRIPGIVATSNGTLIAYCEGRSSGSDWATMDLVIKRSTDGGETWSEPIVLFDGINTGKTYNNPVMIADKNSGLVHLVYCIGYATAYYVKSLDHGVTWSTPVDITATFNEFKTEYNWVVIAAGPGHGIQLKNGRLIIPVWLALNKSHAPSVTSVIYSDDKGVTWKRGEIIKGEDYMPDPNETTAVELMDGSVLLNMRNKSSEKKRAVTISKDGVNNWSTPKLHEDLDDAVCFASMIRLTGNDEYYNNRILFSNINNTAGRSNLTIKVSMDEGNTWEITRTIYAGGAAYSDLAVSGDKKEIYCLYEKDGYNKLVLAKFNLEWITMDKQKLNPINDISKIVYPTSSNIVLTEEWNSLDKWNIAGQGQVNLTDMNTLSMYSNNGNNTSITNRHLNIRSKYSIEFKARFKDFVAGTLGANVTLGTKVCDGKYRLMLDFKPNGVYAITGLGTWESIKNVTINNDWNIWRVEVDNGNATLYVNNELMTTFTLALRASNDLVEHWINGLSNDVSEIEEEYFK